MYLEKTFIIFSHKLIINSISNYRNLMIKFINNYIEIFSNTNTINNNTIISDAIISDAIISDAIISDAIISDAIIYSKYYLYYKTKNCTYNDDVMNIIYDIDHHIVK
jgi:hypothetical protein